jgi:hypothetical protein
MVHTVTDSGVPGGLVKPPPPPAPAEIAKFWQSWEEFPVLLKYIRNNLVKIRVSPIFKLSGTPDKGATAPRSPFYLPSGPQLNL